MSVLDSSQALGRGAEYLEECVGDIYSSQSVGTHGACRVQRDASESV